MRDALKPCPFCGSQPRVGPTDPHVSGDALGFVECCNAECPVLPYCGDGEDVVDDRGSDEYKAAAIRRWNRRAEGGEGMTRSTGERHDWMDRERTIADRDAEIVRLTAALEREQIETDSLTLEIARLTKERGLPDDLAEGIRNADLATGTGRLVVLRLLRSILSWHEALKEGKE